MDVDRIAAVRRFNRTVTQRVGALDDRYMARDRPLGQARLLWEIGPAGAEVAALRGRLGLDSGYLSRLLRALEADGLVTVEPSSDAVPPARVLAAGTHPAGDARLRTAHLTDAGQREWTELDRRSDDLARSVLAPLTPPQQAELVAAMARVERLLVASRIVLAPCPPGAPQARACLRAYAREIAERFDGGFDPALSNPVHDEELVPPRGVLLVATLGSEPVGCGAVKLHPGAPAELKRVWVAPDARGLGVGRRILTALERHAAEHGWTAVRLDTNRSLIEAMALYRSAGYLEIPAYNSERYAHHWFEKQLRP